MFIGWLSCIDVFYTAYRNLFLMYGKAKFTNIIKKRREKNHLVLLSAGGLRPNFSAEEQ